MSKPLEKPSDSEEEYIGNIWGWKFSFISLGIIVAMLLLMWYRYATMEQHHPQENPDQPEQVIERDSTLY